MKYWNMLQPDKSWSQQATWEKLDTHFYEMSRIGKSIGAEGKLVVARGLGGGGNGE